MTTGGWEQTCTEERAAEGAHVRLDSTGPVPAQGERSGNSGKRPTTGPADCGLAAACRGRGCPAAGGAGLTALSDAHLQKACLFLHPLKYVISGAYEALQEKK